MEKLYFTEKDKDCRISFLLQRSVGETYPIHTHDFYELFYVVKGRAMHSVNGMSECLLFGTAELLRPEDSHEYSFINRYDMELISIGIEREVMQEILSFVEVSEGTVRACELPLKISYHAKKAESVASKLMKLQRITDSKRRRTYAKTLISQILLDMLDHGEESLSIPFWLDALLIEMTKQDNFCMGLPRMLELSNVSQSHLNREMKKYLGLTPTEFINFKRIAYASELLLENKYTITEISGKCGFETASNFYENFKRVYDCSPKEFMRRQEVDKLV